MLKFSRNAIQENTSLAWSRRGSKYTLRNWLRSVANRKTRISIRHVGIYVQVQNTIGRTAVPFSLRQSTTKVALVKATQPCNSDVVYSKYPNKFHSFFMTLHLRTLHIYGANETKMVTWCCFSHLPAKYKKGEMQFTPLFYLRTIFKTWTSCFWQLLRRCKPSCNFACLLMLTYFLQPV